VSIHKNNLLNVESFFDYIKNQRRYSNHTLRAYKNDLFHFIDYLGEDKNIIKINKYDLHEYITFISKSLSSKSLSRKVATIKSLYRFLSDEEIIDYNISKSIKTPKIEKKLPNYVSINDMKTFFKKTLNEIEISRRDLLIIDILYSTGIRVSECSSILIKDINLDNKTIKVTGKGNKERMVVFGDQTKKNMLNYLNDILDYQQECFLFPSKSKKKSITTRTIYNIVKKYIKLVSNNEKLGPHSLRHSFATHLLEGGSNLMAIKDLLGHESLSSTQIYTHLDIKRMKEIYNKSHPQAKK
tara:strand:- start:211 stop:1104 length:894 start_codon:yes stop_codon:yes gene_type:complete